MTPFLCSPAPSAGSPPTLSPISAVPTASLSLRREDIENALASLPERERQVIELRFGLMDDHDHTLEEVGKKLKVTRERVRQIEERAIRKLRHPQSSRLLKDYLD